MPDYELLWGTPGAVILHHAKHFDRMLATANHGTPRRFSVVLTVQSYRQKQLNHREPPRFKSFATPDLELLWGTPGETILHHANDFDRTLATANHGTPRRFSVV